MNEIENMSTFELARWLSLVEAVNIIGETCEDRKQDFNTLNLEPLHIRKYVEKTCDIYARRIEEEQTAQREKAQSLLVHTQKMMKELVSHDLYT